MNPFKSATAGAPPSLLLLPTTCLLRGTTKRDQEKERQRPQLLRRSALPPERQLECHKFAAHMASGQQNHHDIVSNSNAMNFVQRSARYENRDPAIGGKSAGPPAQGVLNQVSKANRTESAKIQKNTKV